MASKGMGLQARRRFRCTFAELEVYRRCAACGTFIVLNQSNAWRRFTLSWGAWARTTHGENK
eukprot:2648511-Karenia_brevis.AAC.1